MKGKCQKSVERVCFRQKPTIMMTIFQLDFLSKTPPLFTFIDYGCDDAADLNDEKW